MNPIVILTLVGIFFSGTAMASGKYDPEKVCPRPNYTPECDLLVESAVAKDISGVIERAGPILRIYSKNGKMIERRNAGRETQETESWKLWACDYFPEHGFVRLCYRLWESSKTEFINIHSGKTFAVAGWPIYPPYRNSVLMVNGYGGAVYSLEIWRFAEKEMQKKFRLENPPGQGWEVARWKSEGEIEPRLERNTPDPKYRLVRHGSGWVLRGE